MANSSVDATASTFGWDTAFAIRVKDVNTAIINKSSSPASFQFEAPDQSCSVKGDFGDWQIGPGGDGNLIHMAIPVPTASLIFNNKTFPLNDAIVTLELKLHYIPHTGTLTATSGTLHDLVIRDTKTDPDDPNEQVASITGMRFSGTKPGNVTKALFEGCLSGWFNDNLADFSHVFSTVNLNRTADKGQFQWLLPTYTSYAYADHPNFDDSLLSVLCMTDNREAIGLVEELSPAAIPDGSSAGFLIGAHRFIDEMVLPAMPLAFKGVKTTDIALNSDGKGLSLKADVQLAPVPHDGKSYTPTLQTLNVTVSETTLTIECLTQTTVSPGVFAHCQHIASYTMAFKKQSNGEPTLIYQPDPNSTPLAKHWTTTSPGIEIAEELFKIITIVVAIIIGILTEGAGLAPALLVAGLLIGAFDEGVKIAQAIGTDDAPSMGLLVLNSTDPIVWTDSSDFSLNWAGLSDSLQMGGNPTFVGAG